MDKIKKIDVIVPVYFLCERFKENVESWIHTIPIKKLYIGVANKKVKIPKIEGVEVEVINQSRFKTLGYCIHKLVEKVETDWFVFLHDDVKLPSEWYKRMWEIMEKHKIDIGESLKEIIDVDRLNQARSWRAYSGAQIIKTKVYLELMNDIDDDFVYTTEDLILQIRALQKKYTYSKITIFHEHQNHKTERSMGREQLLLWQVKAFIKYCPPLKVIQESVDQTMQGLKEELKRGWLDEM